MRTFRTGRLRRVEPRQRRAQRVEAWGVGISVVFDGPSDGRRYRGELGAVPSAL